MRSFCLLAALLAALAVTPRPGMSQTYPDHTVRVIVPTAPAGAIDGVARAVTQKLSERWGQPVVIDNKPGASMTIGTELAAKSPADGYTLLVAHDGAMAMNVATIPNLPYAPLRDFAPVSLMVSLPLVVMVNNGVAATSVKELIEVAKRNPGKLNHGSGGPTAQLALALFKHMAGVDIVDVVYKGGALAVTSCMAGETQICIADIASATSGMQSPQLRVLAVTSGKRLARLPDLPTVTESGLPGYEDSTWIGLFAPAATPQPILAKLEADVRAALQEPDVRARLAVLSVEIQGNTGAETKERLSADIKKWSDLVRETGLKLVQ
jgi:tripartite-type tricarboxylate transporter receptor subunit TctC